MLAKWLTAKPKQEHHAPIYQPNVVTAEETTRQMLRPAQSFEMPEND
jgi:hypothetical protein